MNLHVMSDLHLDLMRPRTVADFWARLRDTDRTGVDTLVLAGDIGSLRDDGTDLLEALHEFEYLYPHVVYVPGNHEFWGTSITAGLDVLDSWFVGRKLPSTEIRAGDTLWFPDPGSRLWIDYTMIRDARWAIDSQHEKWKTRHLVLSCGFEVTHHLPTYEAVAPRWHGALSNDYFVAGLEDWLRARIDGGDRALPKLWICGHTHDPVDVQSRFGFRIYANPLGYEREGANPGFWDRLLVEVP